MSLKLSVTGQNYLNIEKYTYYLLLLTVALIPLQQVLTTCMIALAGCLGMVTAFLGRHEKKQAVLPRWFQVLLWLFILLGYYSLHYSVNQDLSTYNFIYVVGQYTVLVWLLLNFGWCSSDIVPKEIQWREFSCWPRVLQLLGTVFVMSLVVSLYGIVQHFLGVVPTEAWVDPDTFPELKTRVVSTLANPNILGGYLVLIITNVLGLWQGTTVKSSRIILGIIIFSALVCLLYTYSRGNWVALVAAVMVFCLCFWRKALLPLLLGIFIGVWLAGDMVLHRALSIFGTEDTSVALRFAYLESTWAIICDYPYGVGWYGYQFVYPTYDFYLNNPNVIMYHSHNTLLNITAELGVQGLIMMLVLLVGACLQAWQLSKQGKTSWLRGIGRGYLIYIVGFSIGGLTDHVYFNMQMGLLFWFLLISLMLCSKLNNNLSEKNSSAQKTELTLQKKSGKLELK